MALTALPKSNLTCKIRIKVRGTTTRRRRSGRARRAKVFSNHIMRTTIMETFRGGGPGETSRAEAAATGPTTTVEPYVIYLINFNCQR